MMRPARRALSQVGGPVRRWGDAGWSARLAEALAVDAPRDVPLPHVHGFHAYPGRMHPETARRLVREAPRGGTVLDPFCGGGTVLVEALLEGRAAIGLDINPLAVRLATLRTTRVGARERRALIELAARTGERARAIGYAPAPSAAEAEWFAPHVLRELAALRAALSELQRTDKAFLELVLSSILIKMSRQSSDSSLAKLDKRHAPGFASRLFVRKTEELAGRLAELEALVPRHAPRVEVLRGDARELRGIADASVDLVVTSPPYGGVYDYAAFQARRSAWLGFESALNQAGSQEIGQRSRAGRGFVRELSEVLRSLRRVLRAGHPALLVLGDGTAPATPTLERALTGSGLRLLASASQRRLRGEEHIFALL